MFLYIYRILPTMTFKDITKDGGLCRKLFCRAIVGVLVGLSSLVVGCRSNQAFLAYQVDNGDDYFSDGLQRIIDKDGKIGFRDSIGMVVIAPRYAFAFPFNDGYAKVADTGHTEAVDESGEYHHWVSDSWYYIDHAGNRHPELIEISGVVKASQDGSLLKDAIITNSRTGKSVLSNSSGRFRALCEKGDSLKISYVGLISREVLVNPDDSTQWVVSMSECGPIIEPPLQKSHSTNGMP